LKFHFRAEVLPAWGKSLVQKALFVGGEPLLGKASPSGRFPLFRGIWEFKELRVKRFVEAFYRN